MPLIFGSKEANEILRRGKRRRVFGTSSLVGHEATTPVDLRIAPTGEPRPSHDLANSDWQGHEDELIAIAKRVIGISDEDDVDHEQYCTICGGYMDWADCWSCHGAGEFDLFDEDPIYYDEGDTEICEECEGAGGHWVCASLPHDEGAEHA